SPARNGLDDRLPAVADGVAGLAHTMRQRLVGHHCVRPNRLDEFLLCDQAAGVFDEIAQDFECLGPQLNLAIGSPQRAGRFIQRVSLETVHLCSASSASRLSGCSDRNFPPTYSLSQEISFVCQDFGPRFTAPSIPVPIGSRRHGSMSRPATIHGG